MDIGMNLSPVNDYNREWVFQNIFKQSREWRLVKGSVVQPPSVKVPVLANGYPDFTQIAVGDLVQSLMLVDQDGRYPKGIYNASWSGEKTGVIFRGSGVKVLSVEKTGDFWTAQVDIQGDKGLILELNNVNIEDMVILMPGHLNNRVFHKDFLTPLNGLKFIRFLNWMNTNSVKSPHTWENRTKIENPRQSYRPQGVALEYMIGLCNQTSANPWFCMPHLFEDSYVLEFAKTVKRLSKSNKIYVEFSNETWNSMFPVHAWARNEAERLGVIWPYVVADHATRVWNIWRSVFADKPERIVRVVGGHVDNEWVAQKILERLNDEADLVAVAAYFRVPRAVGSTFNQSTTAEQVLEAANSTLLRLSDGIKLHKTLGKPVGVYEGGQGIIGDTNWFTAAYEAQLLPGMYTTTLNNLVGAEIAGATCFGIFSYISRRDSPHGSWGHLEYQDQIHEKNIKALAPKAAAIRDYLLR